MRKENQGIRDTGQFGRVPDFFVVHLSFSVVSGRGVLNTPHKRPGRGEYIFVGCPIFVRQDRAKKHTPSRRPDRGGFKTMGRVKFLEAGAFNMKGGGVAPSPLHPFLALMQEKDAKRKSRHQGCRPNFPSPGRCHHRDRGIWSGSGKGSQGCRPI